MGLLASIISKFVNISQDWKQKYIRRRGGQIGKNTTILSGVDCFGSEPYLISIGDDCLISTHVTFVTHDGSVNTLNNLNILDHKVDKLRPIKLGNNVFIGTRVIIMPGVTIGDNCIIGAGSIVTKDVPDCSCVVGVPAKVISDIYQYAEKNKPYFYPTYDMDALTKKEYVMKNMSKMK